MMSDLGEEVPCGFLSFCDNGTLRRTNEVLRTLLGWTSAELSEKKAETLLSIASRLFFQTHLLPLLRLQGRVDEVSLTLLTKDRQPIPTLVNIVRRPRAHETVFDCALMVFRERHRFEADLFAAQHAMEKALGDNVELTTAKGELESYSHELDRQLSRSVQRRSEISRVSQVLAHDLSEPARKLRLFADYLADDAGGHLPPAAQRHLQRIHAESARIQHLIRNLQTFLEPEPSISTVGKVELETILSRAIAQVSSERKIPSLTVNCDTLPAIQGYDEDLHTLFYHLVNTLCESDHGPLQTITIEACILKQNTFKALPGKYQYDDAVRLIFAVKTLPFDVSLMELFLTAGTKLPREWEQVSFNLALCQKLTEHHRGTFLLGSSSESGQRLTVYLPLKQ